MNILVTGGAGYIGSHTCKALSNAGFLPITYDNLSSGHEWAVRWGPLERGDILDRDRLDQVLGTYRPSAVIHFAAYAYVGESVEHPAKYYRNNVVGSLNLLEAMRSNRGDANRLLEHLLHLRCPTKDPHHGGAPTGSDQSLWCIEIDDRANAGGLRRSLWDAFGFTALLQRGWCRS